METPHASNETRDDVLHAPNLFEFFCARTAQELRAQASLAGPPVASFAGLVLTVLLVMAFSVFGQPGWARAALVAFGLFLAWTVWAAVIRSSEPWQRDAASVKAGMFPPASAPYVVAKLKWWNGLVQPLRWGRHSRLYDRRVKLQRKIEDTQRRLNLAGGSTETETAHAAPLPTETEITQLAERLDSPAHRLDYETENAAQADPPARLRGELLLYLALQHNITGLTERLERIDSLTVAFTDVNPDDLSPMVTSALQVLDERRALVVAVDRIDPESFIELVSVRPA